MTLAETGGAQTYVSTLVPALVGRYAVTVAAHGAGPLRTTVTQAGAAFVPLRHVRRPISAWRDLVGLLELVVLVRRVRPHIVHANSSKAGVLGRVAAWIAGAPVRVFTVHGWAFSASSAPRSVIYRWAERLVRRLTTATICVSETERAAGLAAGTCDERRTFVIRNGIDVATRPVARPETNPPRIVAVGRLQAPKDVLCLVRAVAMLQQRSFSVLVVGDGPDRHAIEAEIRRLESTRVVDLAGGRTT